MRRALIGKSKKKEVESPPFGSCGDWIGEGFGDWGMCEMGEWMLDDGMMDLFDSPARTGFGDGEGLRWGPALLSVWVILGECQRQL